MKKLNLRFTLLILLFSSISAMNKELFIELRTLPTELQQHILLLKDDINFLSLQPITLTRPNRNNSYVNCVVIDHDIVITANCNAIRIWDIHTNQLLRTIASDSDNPFNVTAVAITDDKIIAVSVERTAKIWNIATGEQLNTLTRPNKPSGPFTGFCSLALHNNLAVIGAHSSTIEIWDINTAEPLHIFAKNRSPNSHHSVWSIAIDDDIIVAGSCNADTTVHDHTGNLLHTITEEKTRDNHNYLNEPVQSVAIHNNRIIHGLWDGNIHIWDKNSNKLLFTLEKHNKHTQAIRSMAVQNNLLLTGSDDCTAKIWDLCTTKCIRTLAGPNGHTDKITSVAMNHEVAITGSRDTTAKIWPLLPDLKGTTEDNPLLWIIHNTNMLQLDFIQRAYEKTIAQENFIITLPKKLGVIEHDESPEQMDGRIYFTLPAAIREYVRTRLNIRK